MVGVGILLIGLFLIGFGAAISLIGNQPAGSVVLIVVGAAVGVIGLLSMDWTNRPVSSEATVPPAADDVQEPAVIDATNPVSGASGALGGDSDRASQQSTSAEVAANEAQPPADEGLLAIQEVESKRDVRAELTAPDTPDDVLIRTEARMPETDPFLGVPVELGELTTEPQHRLVVLGDSLSQGFQSLAMFRTDLSYPAMIAKELGCYDSYRHPEYPAFGGLPLNLEYIVRKMEHRHGPDVNWWEHGSSAFYLDDLLVKIRDYWQDGPGTVVSEAGGIMHNLALPGADVRDLLTLTADTTRERLADESMHVHGAVCNGGLLLAHSILATARDPNTRKALTAVEAAIELGKHGGIETLIVFIGFSNAVGAVLDLRPTWSAAGYDDPVEKGRYNVWRPIHFERELGALAARVREVGARHVIWATVPHVTILPIARGAGGRTRPDSRYFARYTRPWVLDDESDASEPCLSAAQARAIDSAIDQYNDAIAKTVRDARHERMNWLLLDVAGLFDRLAARRYGLEDAVDARPPWWDPYPLPEPVARLTPAPDSRFIVATPERQGGLFSLDGVHPTTTAYAILAQEFINVMVKSGVEFRDADGNRRERPAIDFSRVITRDTLVSDPPRSITEDLEALAWADQQLNWIRQLRRLL